MLGSGLDTHDVRRLASGGGVGLSIAVMGPSRHLGANTCDAPLAKRTGLVDNRVVIGFGGLIDADTLLVSRTCLIPVQNDYSLL